MKWMKVKKILVYEWERDILLHISLKIVFKTKNSLTCNSFLKDVSHSKKNLLKALLMTESYILGNGPIIDTIT